jgi:hypothetical protein
LEGGGQGSTMAMQFHKQHSGCRFLGRHVSGVDAGKPREKTGHHAVIKKGVLPGRFSV